MNKLYYILLFFILVNPQVNFTQALTDEEFEQLIEDIGNDKEIDVDEIFEKENSSSYNSYDNNPSQKEYLNTPIEKKNFSRAKWEKIKRRVVDNVVEEEGSYDSDSPYGRQKLKDQDNPYQKSEKNYRKYWDKKQKNSKQVKTRPKKQRQNNSRPRNNSSSSNFSVSPLVGQVLLIIVVLILVALIFYLFFKAPVAKSSKKIAQDISEISPTEIPKSELELMLEKALANEDYREAIRIYFIFILRALSEKEWIDWEKEKTNFSYLVEMRKNKYYNDFETSVSVYEIVWYGKRVLNKQTYSELEPTFKSLIERLEK
jgi:hypothetical protein